MFQLPLDTELEVFWPDDKQWFKGTIVGIDEINKTHTVHYDDGDVEKLNLLVERYRLLGQDEKRKKTAPWAAQMATYLDRLAEVESIPPGERNEITALLSSSLSDATYRNYRGKVKGFLAFCDLKSLTPLPASASTALRYVNYLRKKGTVKATSFQPYFSAINSMHLDLRCPAPLTDIW